MVVLGGATRALTVSFKALSAACVRKTSVCALHFRSCESCAHTERTVECERVGKRAQELLTEVPYKVIDYPGLEQEKHLKPVFLNILKMFSPPLPRP